MLKVLLVDDEFIVRQGLKTLVNWEKYGMSVAAEAANGKNALDWLKQEDFQVVITDIRMPVVDGIELTRMITERYPGTKVILLTCYSDFEYVQEALELGASGYLLKTEMEDGHLEKTLLKIKQEIEEEKAKEETLKEAQKKVETSIQVLRENYVRSVLENDEGMDVERGCEHVGLQFLNRRHMIWRIEFERMNDQMKKEVERIFQAIFAEDEAFILQLEAYEFLAFSTYPSENSQYKIYAWEQMITHECFSRLSKIGHVNVYYDSAEGIGELPKKYRKISQVGQFYTFYHGFDFLVDVKDVPKPRSANLIEKVDWNKIKEKIIARDWFALKEKCQAVFQMVSRQSCSVQSVKLLVIETIVIIVNELSVNHPLIKPWGKNKFDYIDKAKEKRTFEQLIQWLYDGIDELEKHQSMLIAGPNHIIRNALKYIEKNYNREITLDELSRHVGLSKCYLSTTFKKMTGQSFTDYVNHLRIEKAKQLFMQIDLKVFEVAEKVGFKDPKYFTKLFKNIEGVSPKHFMQKKYSAR